MYLVNISFLSESAGVLTSVLLFGVHNGSVSEILPERSMANEARTDPAA